MSSIQVVIVTWNSERQVARALASCAQMPVIVVDNASTDRTIERVREFPNVELIANTVNRGFAAAVNQGFGASTAPCVLLLNPDVELLGDPELLARACLSPGVVAATGRLLGAAGQPQRGFAIRRLPRPSALAFEALGLNALAPWNPVNRRYRHLDFDFDYDQDVEQPPGAFLAIRRETWLALGGFDEQFFPVWFEDADFCRRALELGRIRYVPSVTARHEGAHSVSRLDWSSREQYWYGSLLRYARKHFSQSAFRGVCGAVLLGSIVRAFVGVFRKRTLKAVAVYARVAGLALRRFFFAPLSPPEWNPHRQSGEVVLR